MGYMKQDWIKYKDEDGRRLDPIEALEQNISFPEPETLKETHQEIARYYVMGLSSKAIALKMQMSKTHVDKIIRSPKFQERVSYLQGELNKEAYDVHKAIAKLVPKAVEIIENMLDSTSDMRALEKLELVKYTLGINNIVPPKDVRIAMDTRTLTVAQVESIRDRAEGIE